MNKQTGILISFEGVDGCGKSTQISRLAQRLKQVGHEVVLVREPGSTPISEAVRQILLNPQFHEMDDRCELLLYEAARAQLVSEVIAPAIQAGKVVLCDRFYDSTTVYQGMVRGLGVDCVKQLNLLAVQRCVPDLTIVLDVEDVSCAYARATRKSTDRLEAAGLAFQRQVRDGFRQLAAGDQNRIVQVPALGTPEEVGERIAAVLNARFGSKLMGPKAASKPDWRFESSADTPQSSFLVENGN